MIDLHTPAADRKGLSLLTKLEVPDELDVVALDEVKVFEILNNLVSNAIKFTDAGFVEIGTSFIDPAKAPDGSSRRLQFMVRDTGSGISTTDLDRIFKPFYQGQHSNRKKLGGTGLGLAIVEELIQTMCGTIVVESRVNLGTSITVTIPLLNSSRERDAVGPPALPATATGRVISFPPQPRTIALDGRVLLVEDNELNAMLASRMLSSSASRWWWPRTAASAVKSRQRRGSRRS